MRQRRASEAEEPVAGFVRRARGLLNKCVADTNTKFFPDYGETLPWRVLLVDYARVAGLLALVLAGVVAMWGVMALLQAAARVVLPQSAAEVAALRLQCLNKLGEVPGLCGWYATNGRNSVFCTRQNDVFFNPRLVHASGEVDTSEHLVQCSAAKNVEIRRKRPARSVVDYQTDPSSFLDWGRQITLHGEASYCFAHVSEFWASDC